MAREFADRTGLPIRTHLDELPAGVSSDIAHALYRIAQETLANASRHASSSSVSLDLNVESETVTLRTIDDGVGFKSVATSSGAGHGLANMQARVDQVGGKLTIRNLEPGAMIEARIPLGF
jgi:signal transduction histidine kinase